MTMTTIDELIKVTKSLNLIDGIGIYQICEVLRLEHNRANSNIISALLRQAGFTKDHSRRKDKNGAKVFRWFAPKKSVDEKDAQIRELQSQVKELEKKLKEYQAKEDARETANFLSSFQDQEGQLEPSKKIEATSTLSIKEDASDTLYDKEILKNIPIMLPPFRLSETQSAEKQLEDSISWLEYYTKKGNPDMILRFKRDIEQLKNISC